jgi:DNA-directed RNA polymerase specialized sigma24 family protein
MVCNIVNAVMTAQPDPSTEPYEKFLIWLSPDRELALRKYNEIMRKIAKYFIRKGCHESEDLASETQDRVIKIIDASPKYPNPDALFYSVANKIWKEYRRRPKPEQLGADDLVQIPSHSNSDAEERKAVCLERCLSQLPAADRDLITRYYLTHGSGNLEARSRLIAEYGGQNTLRVKAFRIRMKLRACIEACMAKTERWSAEFGAWNDKR